jgi:transcriptional regulator with XRE-family HTH domain
MPWLDRLEAIESAMGLTRSQLAQVLLVERATLHHWLRGAQPCTRSLERIDELAQVAQAWQKAGLGSARGAWYLRAPTGRLPLGELLSTGPLDQTALQQLIRTVAQDPNGLETVLPRGLEGFPPEDAMEARRRTRDLFAPTFSDKD